MHTPLNEDSKFENIDFSEKKLSGNKYSNCEFVNCNFTKANLKNCDFVDCSFKGCNFTLALLENAGIKNVAFAGCKLMGINFSACNSFLFSVTFQDCILDYSSFFQKKMKKTNFTNCSLKEADFEEADLSLAAFNNCDLLSANFMHTILEKTDFRTATNYAFDPELNKVKKARFSHYGIAGLLSKYDIEIE